MNSISAARFSKPFRSAAEILGHPPVGCHPDPSNRAAWATASGFCHPWFCKRVWSWTWCHRDWLLSWDYYLVPRQIATEMDYILNVIHILRELSHLRSSQIAQYPVGWSRPESPQWSVDGRRRPGDGFAWISRSWPALQSGTASCPTWSCTCGRDATALRQTSQYAHLGLTLWHPAWEPWAGASFVWNHRWLAVVAGDQAWSSFQRCF